MDKILENQVPLKANAEQFFDNPLRKEFLTFDQIVSFFSLYGERWIRRQMAEGHLPYRTYGRDGILFYVPEVRQAILDGSLAPIKKVQDDYNSTNKNRQKVRSKSQSEGFASIQDLRRSEGS